MIYTVLTFALIACTAFGQMPSKICPLRSYENHTIVGKNTGYLLSTINNGTLTTIYQAAMNFDITESSATGALTGVVTLSNPHCTQGCAFPLPKTPPAPCVTTYELVCLDQSHNNIMGWKLTSTSPSCLTDSSPWKCTYKMTGTYYQDIGHNAVAYFTTRWDAFTSNVNFRLDPFGNFFTGCGADANSLDVTLSGRMAPTN